MKQTVSPVAAIIAIVVVVLIAGLAWMRFSAGGPGKAEAKGGMPPEAAAELQKVLGGNTTGPPKTGSGGTSAPSVSGPGGGTAGSLPVGPMGSGPINGGQTAPR